MFGLFNQPGLVALAAALILIVAVSILAMRDSRTIDPVATERGPVTQAQ